MCGKGKRETTKSRERLEMGLDGENLGELNVAQMRI
jgi:hypothetical protein